MRDAARARLDEVAVHTAAREVGETPRGWRVWMAPLADRAVPGLGRLVFQAITQRDLIVVEGVVMVLVLAVIAVTFLTDIAYALADPRLRRSA